MKTRLFLLVFAAAANACADAGSTANNGSNTTTLPSFDIGTVQDSGTDAALNEFKAGDAGATCPGGTGCACKENSECDNSLCLETGKGKFCAKICVDSCPTGLSCAPFTTSTGDNLTVCIDRFARLCDPCSTDADCQAQAGSGTGQAVCIDQGADGKFCGAPCTSNGDCPANYACADVTSSGGKPAKQCQRQPDQPNGPPAACACSAAAVAKKLATTCASEAKDAGGKVIGSCPGTRACGVGGLSACQAPPAAKETCDGLDNDCNGLTDDAACDDKNQCTTDICDPAKGCSHQPGDLPCDADNNACTVGDLCQNGVCLAGKAKDCNDQNPCTVDKCVPATGCVQAPDDGAPCNDDNPCTIGDVCAKGTCSGGKPKVCPSGDPCVDAKCNLLDGGCKFTAKTEGAPCDDGQACTAGETCQSGNCTGGKAVGCDDGNACTIDVCNAAGQCTSTPAASGAACNDGNPCDQGASCQQGTCKNGKPKDCADANPCTADSCDVSSGQCTHAAIPGCTGACPTGVCPDDGNPCTSETCVANQCIVANKNGACNVANNACNPGTCDAGQCKPNGAAKNCDDANPCTDDSCDAGGGNCNHVPNSAPCDDGVACTAPDACSSGVCKAGPAACNLGDPCNGPNQCKVGACVNGKCSKPAVACGMVGKAATGTLGDVVINAAAVLDTDAGTLTGGVGAPINAGAAGVFEVQQPGGGFAAPAVLVFDTKSFKVLAGAVLKIQGKRAAAILSVDAIDIQGSIDAKGSGGGSGIVNAGGSKGLAGAGGWDGGGFVSGPGCGPTNGMGAGPSGPPAGPCGSGGGTGGSASGGASGGGGGGGCGGSGGGGGGRADPGGNGANGEAPTAAAGIGTAYGGNVGGSAGSNCSGGAGPGSQGGNFADSLMLAGGSGGAAGGFGGFAGFGGKATGTKNDSAAGGTPGFSGGGGGGGGGGGAVMLCSGAAIAVGGGIDASGGMGGVGSGSGLGGQGGAALITSTGITGGGGGSGRSGAGGGGGGGGGGTVHLIAPNVTLTAAVTVKGGLAGSNGLTFGAGGSGGLGRNGGPTGASGGGGGNGGKGGAGGQGFVRVQAGNFQGAMNVQGQLVQVGL